MKIEFGGKERGFQFGMGAIELYCDAMGCGIEGIDLMFHVNGVIANKAITNMMIAAMTNYSELADEVVDPKMTYRRVQSWLDEAPNDTLSKILEDFKKSKYLGRSVEDYYAGLPSQEDTEKK